MPRSFKVFSRPKRDAIASCASEDDEEGHDLGVKVLPGKRGSIRAVMMSLSLLIEPLGSQSVWWAPLSASTSSSCLAAGKFSNAQKLVIQDGTDGLRVFLSLIKDQLIPA